MWRRRRCAILTGNLSVIAAPGMQGGLMSKRIGRSAVVLGAGIGGLTSARVLSDYFESVIVLEGDQTPLGITVRPGTPQSNHIHAPLAGGLRALMSLYP